MEEWRLVEAFPKYDVSDQGRVRMNRTGHVIAQYENQSGTVCCGMMRDGQQFHRSVPRLVAMTFLDPSVYESFDTPINLDGDRHNNRIENLIWRPRWFAVKYNRQFADVYINHIDETITDVETGRQYLNSMLCAMEHGLLEEDLVLSIANNTIVWPTNQKFMVLD